MPEFSHGSRDVLLRDALPPRLAARDRRRKAWGHQGRSRLIGDKQIPIGVKRKLAALLQDKPPQGEQGVILWPRTDKEGLLGSGTQLALHKSVEELGREPGLHALGELVKVDKENALLQLQIHPNEKQGSLSKPFKLPLVASLELLEGLPEPGSGLEVWAELKPRTERLVVTRAQVVSLPPKRVTVTAPVG